MRENDATKTNPEHQLTAKQQSINSLNAGLFFSQSVLSILGGTLVSSSFKRRNKKSYMLLRFYFKSFYFKERCYNYKYIKKYRHLKGEKQNLKKDKQTFIQKHEIVPKIKEEKVIEKSPNEKINQTNSKLTNDINLIKNSFQGMLFKKIAEKYFDCVVELKKPKNESPNTLLNLPYFQIQPNETTNSNRIMKIKFNDSSINFENVCKNEDFQIEMQELLIKVKDNMMKEGKYFLLQYDKSWRISKDNVHFEFLLNGESKEVLYCPIFCGLINLMRNHLNMGKVNDPNGFDGVEIMEEMSDFDIMKESNEINMYTNDTNINFNEFTIKKDNDREEIKIEEEIEQIKIEEEIEQIQTQIEPMNEENEMIEKPDVFESFSSIKNVTIIPNDFVNQNEIKSEENSKMFEFKFDFGNIYIDEIEKFSPQNTFINNSL